MSELNVNLSKPVIDTSVFGKWPSLGNTAITNNGNYALYTVNNKPLKSRTLVIKALKHHWKKEFINVSNEQFTCDNKYLLFNTEVDSLGILNLDKDSISFIKNVVSWSTNEKNNSVWIAYRLKDDSGLIVKSLSSETEYTFDSAEEYKFSHSGDLLLLQTRASPEPYERELYLINLLDGSKKKVWHGTLANNIIFDGQDKQIAFVTTGNKTEPTKVCCLRFDSDKPIIQIDSSSFGKDFLITTSLLEFSKDNSKLYFHISRQPKVNASQDGCKIDIWSYLDLRLKSQESTDFAHDPGRNFLTVVNLYDKSTIRIENENDRILGDIASTEGDYLLVYEGGDKFQDYWNKQVRGKIYLVSTKDGSRKLIRDNLANFDFGFFTISPGGRFVIFYDSEQKNYFSYDIVSDILRNITKDIPSNLFEKSYDRPGPPPPVGLGSFIVGDSGLLIYDNCDIWKVDLFEGHKPVNITNGYGRKNGIVFKILNDKVYSPNDSVILLAFNTNTKENGFFLKALSQKGNPALLSMGPYLYSLQSLSTFIPIKAKDSTVFVVRRMSSTKPPNLYITNDFKKFITFSDEEPNKAYNWYTTEIITWRKPDGKKMQGVLYKPENFDSSKKYPLLFYVYERLSDRLNLFIYPTFSDGTLNIPYYVSNGYLVFTPDIEYKIGEPGESAYNSVISSFNYLKRNKWIDTSHMGIQGHSFGGYEVNYLITRTNIFAAAASACGLSDFVSGYGSTFIWGDAKYLYEKGQVRIGVTLWENPQLYIKNSPVFGVNRIQTPLLMMNNKYDPLVPFAQGVELFTTMRRLNKKVWMLQYDHGGHEVGGKEAIDYSCRLYDFFQYYLKGGKQPKWMSNGGSQ